jgi:hypothetical protein
MDLPKKLPIFIAEISEIILKDLLNWILKNKIIIQHPSPKPENGLQYYWV